MLLQQVGQRLGLAEALGKMFLLVRRHFASGQQQVALPGFARRQLDAGFERHVEIAELQAQRHAVGDAHAFEIKIAVAIDQIFQITLGGLAQFFRRMGLPHHLPKKVFVQFLLVADDDDLGRRRNFLRQPLAQHPAIDQRNAAE